MMLAKTVENEQLERGLENRHIQLIAIGGTIGIGLFLGSAIAIKTAGPSIILSYVVGGVIALLVLRALGEMAVRYPVSGSFGSYAGLFVGEWAGYVTNWTYWYSWIIACMVETTAVGLYMKFWYPNLPQWITALACLIALTGVNLVTVKAYGEFEFWFALIKVVTIVGLIILGGCMIVFGLGNGGVPIGISNLWTNGGFFPNGFTGFILSFLMVCFSFAGVEMIGITAGEAKDPEKTLPSAIDKVFWRLLIFYVGAIFVILSLYPWNSIGTFGSPFVTTFDRMGIRAAASIINFVICTAALSSCNSGVYIMGRMLYNLAVRHEAPAVFAKVRPGGVPANAILFSMGLALIGVVLNYIMPEQVFFFIASFGATAGLWTWFIIALAHLKYRRSLTPAEVAAAKFKMPFFPLGNILIWAYQVIILVSLWLDPGNRITLYISPLWYVGVLAAYYLYAKPRKARQGLA